MHRIRCIFAVIFAILIANPACCCAATRVAEKTQSHSCCGSKKEKKAGTCQCESHGQKIAEKKTSVPDAPVFTLPPAADLPVAVVVVPHAPATIFPGPVDTGPPRRLLVLFQRYLI